MKEYITGIGGIFFKTPDSDKTRSWYENHFGLTAASWGKVFMWRDHANPENIGSTSWSPFKTESDYFGNPNQQFMINYRVRDLDELLEKLQSEGIQTVKETESHEFGKFAWIEDLNGQRIELWEPIDSALDT